MEVYLDNAATTKCFPQVAELMTLIMSEDYGNAASLHQKGITAEKYLRYAREVISAKLKVKEDELIFTSGGTESDNLALAGAAVANRRRGNHIITTAIEHPAVEQTMEYLEAQGFLVTRLPVDDDGVINLRELERVICDETILVSIIHVNNETGIIQPLDEIGVLLRKVNPGIIFHTDAVQGFGRLPLSPKRSGIDLLTASAHKLHGPKGVGFLYKDERVKLSPISYGGGQQGGWRSGTENIPGIAGMAKAADLMNVMMDENIIRMNELRDRFLQGLTNIPQVTVNRSDSRAFAPYIVSVTIAGIKSEVLLHALGEKGIYVSAGNACSARKQGHKSPTLKAIGLSNEMIDSTVRFSFSHYTETVEIDYTLQAMYDIIPVLRKYVKR
ncbi:MAG: cysteine desulfurase [Lachnospiraceae bacterium]|jgi:cysteine desulfurase|nr:cysteine desulfurase [Lachnospiraceae bacterium]